VRHDEHVLRRQHQEQRLRPCRDRRRLRRLLAAITAIEQGARVALIGHGTIGGKAQVVRLPMSAVLRARTIGETRGFMKALIDPRSEHILGFAMLGAEAGEVVAVVQTAMLAGLRYARLRDAILTHPTMAEGLNELFASISDQEKL
jgi:hypothetical protein